ncbi:hypothetical protein GpartN1_g484.t1 [Galdieria partita]|uniref:GDT1 family protein n=1 Tax=Galdieria partita TaxID=83374 RepID=A0A9C7UMJ8_9RHOD|nr:hypothetical protein GpartN1_g484.t1 [Galdieria partita]
MKSNLCSEYVRLKNRLSFVLPSCRYFNYQVFHGYCKRIFTCRPTKVEAKFYKKQYPRLVLQASMLQNHFASLLGISGLSHMYSATGSSFSLILFSEIGDKTFFLAALLAMKYPKRIVFLGTLVALVAMTILSVLLGQLFHLFPNQLHTLPIDDYIATALLFWFGVDNIRAFLRFSEQSPKANKWQNDLYQNEYASASKFQHGILDFRSAALRHMFQVFVIIFSAEWGDKSMLATVALSATQPPIAVMFGATMGHLFATVIAVLGGSAISQYVSERFLLLLNGSLFLLFAFLTALSLF